MTIFIFICFAAGCFGFGASAFGVMRPSLYDDPALVYFMWVALVASGLLVALVAVVSGVL